MAYGANRARAQLQNYLAIKEKQLLTLYYDVQGEKEEYSKQLEEKQEESNFFTNVLNSLIPDKAFDLDLTYIKKYAIYFFIGIGLLIYLSYRRK